MGDARDWIGRLEPSRPLEPLPEMPRLACRRIVDGELVIGEWSLTGAAFTDLHQHVEINYVVEGELHVTFDGETRVATTGDSIVVPPGSVGRYAAPVFARMIYVYGPSTDGHAAAEQRYEEL
jgi:quercetin dioxygenase-like cupin family protein